MKTRTTRNNAQSRILLLLGMLLLNSCAGIPDIKAINSARVPEMLTICENAFPKGKWQFVHAIEATLAGGREAQLIGVTELSSNPERIHAVMMTIEGLVLFDGLFDGKLTINRGIAPFDSPEFAQGLMEDIRLIFFKPAGEPIGAGITDQGFDVCRYRVAGDGVVDVMVRPDHRVEIREYRNERLIRKVSARLRPSDITEVAKSFPEKITLTAQDPANYRLNLRLISAEKITD